MRAMAMVPTYNESGNIGRLIEAILAQGEDIGIVVVDDDSPDGTWRIVEEYSKKDPRVHLLRRIGRRGRGTAGIEGFQYAVRQGVEFVIEMDADFSHKPSYIPAFLKEMGDCDLLIGSRMVKGGGETGRGPLRRWITKGANLYIRLILGLSFKDCTSGYRVFRRDVLETIGLDDLISTGPSIVQEVLYKAYRKGFRIKEYPIIFEDRTVGQSTFNSRIMRQSLMMAPKIRCRYRKA
jgi:dolichol-phosphate mannosyltransferase